MRVPWWISILALQLLYKMYLKITPTKSPMDNVWLFQIDLYDSDWVHTKPLEVNDVIIDILREVKLEINEGSLSINTHQWTE